MKVLVPLNKEENLIGYKNAGAGEFYIGFFDPEWHKAFGEYADLNRLTGFRDMANYNTFEDVLRIIKKVKEEKLILYVTFNSSIYSEEQLRFMERYMQPLYEVGVDGIIVSCPELVKIAKNYKLNAVVSTIAGVYNSDIARYYRNLGARRIILPRDLSITDIRCIIKKVPDLEYEVFMMRDGCSFSDSNCLGLHRSEKVALCTTLSRSECELITSKEDFKVRHDMELNHMLYHNGFHTYACGLCSIYRFVQMGIQAGKIVGRGEKYEEICEDIRLLADNIKIAKTCKSETEYLDKMRFPSKRVVMCKMGMNCYYPEIRF